MARQIDMRPYETGAFLSHLYAALEPDAVRQSRTARGMQAFAEDVGSYLPERNDPHETPCYERPDVMMGDIIPFEAAACQTILARNEGGHTRHPLGAAGGMAVHERSHDVGTAWGRRGPLPRAIQAGGEGGCEPWSDEMWEPSQDRGGLGFRGHPRPSGRVPHGHRGHADASQNAKGLYGARVVRRRT
jgi:hypothetical protein